MTTITDTFNRADQTPLGTTSDGTATWVAADGSFKVVSNQAAVNAVGASAHAYTTVDAGFSDGTVQLTIAAIGGNEGVLFRFIDINNHWLAFNTQLFKVSAGSFIAVGTAYSAFIAGDVISVVLSGSSVTLKRNGATLRSTTDSFQSTATKFGMYGSGGAALAARFDDFSIASPPAPPAWRPPAIVVRSRAIARSSVI